ncbi:reductive dehalogenase [Chloroflexota bacterium]
MVSKKVYPKILLGKYQLGPYPMEKLKRVAKPTIHVTNEIERIVQRPEAPVPSQRGNSSPSSNVSSPFTGSTRSISMALMSSLNMIGQGQGTPTVPSTAEVRNTSSSGSESDQSSSETISVMREQAQAVMSNELSPEKVVLPDDPVVLSRHIKSMAYFAGAHVVGICELPQWALYSEDKEGNPVECNHKYAICIAVDQGRETMLSSNGNDWVSGSQSGRGYAMCGFIGSIVANYIRMMGYPSRLNFARDYQVIVPPLLMLSGIGELSRANIVLNPFLGLRFKASVVTTDLPLEPDKPIDFGLQDFCDKCMKCAIECPSKSISTRAKVMRNGYENWEFDTESCRKYRFANPKGYSCGKCIKVCPWNKPEGWTHDLVRWMVEHAPFLNDSIIKMDNVWGYGKPELDKKWWFDPPKP